MGIFSKKPEEKKPDLIKGDFDLYVTCDDCGWIEGPDIYKDRKDYIVCPNCGESALDAVCGRWIYDDSKSYSLGGFIHRELVEFERKQGQTGHFYE